MSLEYEKKLQECIKGFMEFLAIHGVQLDERDYVLLKDMIRFTFSEGYNLARKEEAEKKLREIENEFDGVGD
ncbi:hypothetical protein [Aneurinibacillus tyrosinisolvens]|uniref:hypothetical protein n=1 Tax=Aneurinibacillus tyrosinisolvens TaxID=1443435 RepID=UPI00063F6E03|nr:hypothetical protein [Aneurinibacillus tyrosinisolvens]